MRRRAQFGAERDDADRAEANDEGRPWPLVWLGLVLALVGRRRR